MPSLNVDLDFFTHPKVRRLVGRLGRGAEVLPLKLWAYTGKAHADNGRLTSYSAAEIESIIEWWGKPGEAIEALIAVGFIEQEGEDFIVHDWLEHEGHLVAFQIRARKANAARWNKIAGENIISVKDASSIAQAPLDGSSYLPTIPNQPRESPALAQDSETPQKRRKPEAHPEAFDAVAQFFKLKGYPEVEAKKFWTYYASNGWRVGRNPMKDWHAAAAGWVVRSSDFAPSSKQVQGPKADPKPKMKRCESCGTDFPKELYLCPKCYPQEATKPPAEVASMLANLAGGMKA